MTRARRTAVVTLAMLALAVWHGPALAHLVVGPPLSTDAAVGQTVVVPVLLSNDDAHEIDAFGLTLVYPSALLRFESVRTAGTLTDGWTAVSGTANTPGQAVVGGFHTTPATTGGTLVDVVFTVTSNRIDSGTLQVTAVYDDLAGATTTSGSFETTVGAGAPGLLGEYYDDEGFTGTLIRRVDDTVDFDWGGGSPDPAMGDDYFSVRWTGYVRPDYTETYTFYTVSDDGVRLWVDGQLVVDRWVLQSATEWSGSISLQAGVAVPVTLEYYEHGGDAVARLSWSSPSRSKQVIPSSHLMASPCGSGHGDVDADGLLTVADATCAMSYFVAGQTVPPACDHPATACELGSADVDCNGAVTPGDARAIALRAGNGLAPADCFEPPPPTPPAYALALSQRIAIDGGTDKLEVTLSAESAAGIDAFGLAFEFPAAELVFDRVEPGWALSGWAAVSAGEIAAGELRVGAWHGDAVATPGPAILLRLYFDFTGAPGEVGGLNVSAFTDDFENAALSGTVSGAGRESPPTLRLLQNHPNPFNPSTTIRFELPRDGAKGVRLAVYSVGGELVRALVDGQRGPGVHAVTWDGTDALGNEVPSGVYFYVLRADNVALSRKMILLK